MSNFKKILFTVKLGLFLAIAGVAGIDVKSAFASELIIEGQRTTLIELDHETNQAKQSKIAKYNIDDSSSDKVTSEVVKRRNRSKKELSYKRGGGRGWSR